MSDRSAPLKLYFDGGCRPNPGQMEIAVVVRGQSFIRSDIGTGSNNDAEWLAALYALQVAEILGAGELLLIGDSAVVVGQASGIAKCRSPELQRHLSAFCAAASRFQRVRLRHVRRNRNLAGIALDHARRGIASAPATFIDATAGQASRIVGLRT